MIERKISKKILEFSIEGEDIFKWLAKKISEECLSASTY